MSIDKNSSPNDLPQLNPNRSLFSASPSTPFLPSSFTAGDPFASDDASDDQPSRRKVKLLCRFGGKILRRPSDGALRYAGGQTRIIAVRRDISLPELYRKMADAYGGPVAIRYQLPYEDIDSLVSVSSAEDLENMMEEYDKVAEASVDGSAKLRVFLFSQAEIVSVQTDNISSGPTLIDPYDSGQKYIEAVNGGALLEAGTYTGDVRLKGKMASAASTQNSDTGCDGYNNEGNSPAILSPSTGASAFVDQSNFGFVSTATSVPPQETKGFPANSAVLGQTILTANHLNPPQISPYPSQPLVESHQVHFVPPHSLNMTTTPRMVNAVPVSQHAYLPHMTIASASVPSQAGGMKPVQAQLNPFTEEDHFGGMFVQPLSDPNYKAFQKPLSQIPPPQPSCLHPPNFEQYELHLVPPLPKGPRVRFEDCQMCQKSLPHVHSDMLINEHGNASGISMPNASPMLHHYSDDAARLQGQPRVVSAAMMENLISPKAEHTVYTEQNGACSVNMVLNSVVDREKFFIPTAEKIDHSELFPPLGDTQASYGAFVSPSQSHLGGAFHQQKEKQVNAPDISVDYKQAFHPSSTMVPGETSYGMPLRSPQPHRDASSSSVIVPPLFPVNQVVSGKPCCRDSSVDNVNYNAMEFLSKAHGDVKQVDGKLGTTEALSLNPFDILTSKSQLKPSAVPITDVPKDRKPENLFLVGDEYTFRPQNGGNALLSSNAFNISAVSPEGNILRESKTESSSVVGEEINTVKSYHGGSKVPSSNPFASPVLLPKENPINPLLSTAMDLHIFELANTLQVSNMNGGIAYTQNFERNAIPIPSNQQVLGTPPYITDVAYNNVVTDGTIGVWKDEVCKSDGTIGVWKDEVCKVQHFINEVTALQRENVPVPLSCSTVQGHDEQFQAINENHFTKVKDHDIAVLLEEGALHPPIDPVIAKKDFIMQDLHDLAKQDGESVPQPSATPASVLSKELSPSFLGATNVHEDYNSHCAAVLGDQRIEDIKVKQSDKLGTGLQTATDIGRLQIIKNCDLEELRELGSGTFGTVYHGKWRGSDVAIKRINDRCFTGKPSEQDKMRGDFWNEASKLADLHHPNVVAFYGVVLDGPGGSYATVTEYMVNGSLRSVLQKNDKTFDRRKRLLIAMDVAFGMEYLHGKNIVHFDLKSDNLLVNLRDPQRPICKVGDLGLSKVKRQTLISGGVRGTLPWMAPELLNGGSNLVSDKVDVFSFGIVMWELLTGEEPYSDLHYGTIIGGIVSNTLRPPVPENCDPKWRALMEQCWAAEPPQRPSFTEIANRLRAMAGSLPQKGKPQK